MISAWSPSPASASSSRSSARSASPAPPARPPAWSRVPTTVCNEIYIELRKMKKHFEGADVLLRVNPETVKVLKQNNASLAQRIRRAGRQEHPRQERCHAASRAVRHSGIAHNPPRTSKAGATAPAFVFAASLHRTLTGSHESARQPSSLSKSVPSYTQAPSAQSPTPGMIDLQAIAHIFR